jgi:RNA polymerase sigma factor (sigma-70 family)
VRMVCQDFFADGVELVAATGDSSALQWIRAHRQGDEEAAGKLWKRYALRVEKLASAWLRRSACPATFDEQDVAISTFEEIFSAIEAGRFREVDTSDELWRLMAIITVRKAKDRLRGELARKRRGEPGTQTVSLDDTDLALDVPSDDPTPEVAAMMAEQLQHLLTAVEDAELERLVVLKLDGYTNDEIGRAMGYSRSSVQRMLRTVRRLWEGTVA